MKRHLPKLLLLVSLLILAGGYYLRTYPVITLDEIIIRGSDKVSAADFDLAAGDNLLALDAGAIVDTLMALPFVESASVNYSLGRDLVITIREKQPLCYFYNQKLWGLSRQCELLPATTVETTSLPVIRGLKLKSKSLYDAVDSAPLRSAVEMISLIDSRSRVLSNRLSEVLLSSSGLRLVLEPGTILVDLGWGDYAQKLDRLESILAGNNNPALYLDLRFGELAIMKTRGSNREVKHGV